MGADWLKDDVRVWSCFWCNKQHHDHDAATSHRKECDKKEDTRRNIILLEAIEEIIRGSDLRVAYAPDGELVFTSDGHAEKVRTFIATLRRTLIKLSLRGPLDRVRGLDPEEPDAAS